MKRNKYKLLPAFILAFLILPIDAEAEEGDTVEPNSYEEKDVDIRTDYFHEESLFQQKKQLSEEQRKLTFDEETIPLREQIKPFLFQTIGAGENHTVIAKAEQVGLFSSDEPYQTQAAVEETDQKNFQFSFDLPILLGVIAAIAAFLLFFLLIPKMGESAKK
ncbi:type VII secretion protein EssA [Bacillus massiliglaciei]|uniref:type VII secretion protein EssA n=1 Tax=Bacillus massiliglaciei TaxID=1816693 RepID=UPI0018FE288F|nr:type VII secretion protein EssA [Bacillus massiliglaciei]